MERFTFKELNELKILAVYAKNFDLAAKLLEYTKEVFPNEKGTEEISIGKTNKQKKGVINLQRSLIRFGGKPIDVKFMEKLFPTQG